MEGNVTLTIHSSTLISSSPPRSSSFSSSTLFPSTLTLFSTSMVVTKTIGNTTITPSSRELSADHLSSFTKEIPSTSSVSAMFSTSQGVLSSSTNLLSSPMEGNSNLTIHSSTLIASPSPRSSSMTFVRPTPSQKQTLPTKSSEAKISSSTITKMAPSSAANVLNYIFLTFDGKLIVSPKSSYKAEDINFKELAGSIESILDKALQQVNEYIYSKILIIKPRDDESKFVCTFKVFLTKPSSETAATLQEKINKYNETNGFGEFTLHSVETSDASNQPCTEERLYMWAIIVIAALGVLCLLFLAAFIYAQRKLKKSRKGNHSSPNHAKNSDKRYSDFFPPVFDGNAESKNVPLQLTSVSSTESKKPLKFSDTVDTDSEQDDENGKKSDKSFSGEDEKEDNMLDVQEQSQSGNAKLQIQDTDDEDDQTKFSTFSRKR
ncbi:Hypothetical predicted protein [Paramuricea clavata]|nr:Hypothetical predicted protein [Paramuricea clavata]